MMSLLPTIALFVLALLWFGALRRQRKTVAAIPLLLHGALLAWLTCGTGSWLLLSTSTLVLTASWICGLLAVLSMRKQWSTWLPIAQAVVCVLSGIGVASAMDGESPSINPWTIPHVAAAVLWFVFVIAATGVALTRLRGRRVGLLLSALCLSAIPLLSSHGSMVRLHQDDQPVIAEATLHDSDGDTAVIRSVPVRGAIPYENPLRKLVLGAIVFGLAVAFVQQKARIETHRGALGLVIVGIVAIHAALLTSALFPRPIDTSHAEVVETVRERLLMETTTTEDVLNVSAAVPPYTGGVGSYAPILLSVMSLVLVFLAYGRRDLEEPTTKSNVLERLEGRVVALGVVFWSLMVLTGCLWSDIAWGSFVVPDPKLYAQILVGGLYALYFSVQRFTPARVDGPSWLLLVLSLVVILSMLGSQLGITAPSLHDFGG